MGDSLSTELGKLRIDKSKRSEGGRRGRFGVWLGLLLLLGAGAAFGIRQYRASAAVTMVETIRPRIESGAEAAAAQIATGYVVAHHKIQVGSKVSGRVAWIGVEKGDRVAKDQVVVRLEDREYRSQLEQAEASLATSRARLAELEAGSRSEEVMRAQSDIDRAEAQMRTDEAYYKRVDELVKAGVMAAQTLDEAKGRFDTSRAALASLTRTYELVQQGPRREQIDSARADVARAKAAADYARTILESAEIRVPIAGTILERNVEQGEMVTTSFVGDRGAKSFVVTLADLNDLQVELDISQNDFGRIGRSQSCNVATDAFPDKIFKCRVDEIAPEANRKNGTVQVKVKILQPDASIRPEMNAHVTFLAESSTAESEKEAFVILPQRAVLARESGKAVLVVSNGVVESKPIKVAKEAGTDVYVPVGTGGMTGVEAVIVGEKLSSLKPGDRVEIKK